jgi:hypothetical protein
MQDSEERASVARNKIRVPLDLQRIHLCIQMVSVCLHSDAALTKLAALDQRKSRVLEMRVFGE